MMASESYCFRRQAMISIDRVAELGAGYIVDPEPHENEAIFFPSKLM